MVLDETFKPSKIDECVFYYGKTIFIVYTDDTILIGPDQQEIDDLIKKLGKVFKIEDLFQPCTLTTLGGGRNNP